MSYKYTQNWFLVSEIRKKLLKFIDDKQEHNILEIGCYEGLSSVFFADNLLSHTGSTLTCVDPFMNIEANDHREFLQNNEETNFDYNISHCKHSDKITIRKITSDEFFKSNTQTFDFIYIDGCHEPDFILRDLENAFEILIPDGIMWMDDYRGGDGIQIKQKMDQFLENHKGQYKIIHNNYQLAITKK